VIARGYFLFLPSLSLVACGIAFGTGAKQQRVPPRFEDVDDSRAHEDEKSENQALKVNGAAKPAPPAVGLSVVVGGTALDAGPLPKPPIPIVKP